MIFVMIGALLMAASGIFIDSKPTKESTQNELIVKQSQQQGNPFNDLRRMALSVTPEQLKLENLGKGTRVFGIVMDWNL